MRSLWVAALLMAVACIASCQAIRMVTAEPGQVPILPTTIPATPTLRPTVVESQSPALTTPQEASETGIAPESQTVTPVTGDTMTSVPTESEEPTDEGPVLRMVYIRARSSREVQQLRQMPTVDITRVRPDPEQPAGEDKLSGGFIVEAVVARGTMAKLTAMGFEISELDLGKNNDTLTPDESP